VAGFELKQALRFAESIPVDVVAIGGDLVNFPSQSSVDDLYKELNKLQVPFVYTAGNHDWHLEKLHDWERTFDAQESPNELGLLMKLYEASARGLAFPNFSDPRFGSALLHSGLRIICIDNSNFQIDKDQLRFFQDMVATGHLFVLLMHIPIFFPGVTLGPEDVMGHPRWSTAFDRNAEIEGRLKWPKQASQSTFEFIEAVQAADRLVAILTGHTHQDAVVPVPCPTAASAAGRCMPSRPRQFTTRANFQGGARLILIRLTGTQTEGIAPDLLFNSSKLACALVSLGCVGAYVLITRPRKATGFEARDMSEISEQGAVRGQQ